MKFLQACTGCCFLCLVFSNSVWAQVKKSVTVKAGTTINETLPAKEIYHYPDFAAGTVYFKDGSTASSRFNYNLLGAEIQFIDAKNDTLAIANEKNVKFVVIGKDTFFYDHGYVELYMSHPVVKLGKMDKITIGDRQKIGAYGMASSAASITSYDKISSGAQFYKLTVQEDIILNWATFFFVGDRENNFSQINKKNLLKMFPAYRQSIESYLKENDVNFLKEDDVVKLVAFLQKG